MSSLSWSLLSVEKSRSGSYRTTRLYPAAFGILNLFFCAYFERYLKHDASGFYLSIFLLIEAVLYVTISSTSFFTVSFEILSKTRIFPTASMDRLLFVIKSNIRRPLLLALLFTNAFFLMLLFRDTFWHGLVAAFVFSLLIATCEILLSVTMLILMRRSVPLGSAVALFAAIVFSIFIGSIVFHFDTLISSIPLIRWTVGGILAATQGEISGMTSNVGWLAFTSAAFFLLGKRFS